MSKIYLCISLLMAACTSPLATSPDATDDAAQAIPAELRMPQPKAIESCGESCENSYPFGCNAQCSLCGAMPGAAHGKCLTALP